MGRNIRRVDLLDASATVAIGRLVGPRGSISSSGWLSAIGAPSPKTAVRFALLSDSVLAQIHSSGVDQSAVNLEGIPCSESPGGYPPNSS